MMNRSRSGCLTCRARRVKCDETFPSCKRCKDTGRICDGPSKDKFKFVSIDRPKNAKVKKRKATAPGLLLVAPTSKSAVQDPAETRAFSYFLACVAPSLAGGFDSEFWTFILPQISESDPTIRRAVLAISDLYEHPPEHEWPVRSSDKQLYVSATNSLRGLTWYNQSLSHFRKHMDHLEDSERAQLALLSCILFASLEFQQNNAQNSLKLLGRGYGVFSHAMKSSTSSLALRSTLVEDMLMPMFHRHVVLMACFGHTPPDEWIRSFHAMVKVGLGTMHSLREARTQLFHLTCSGLALIHATGALIGSTEEDTMDNLELQQQVLMSRVHTWHSNFQQLLNQKWQLFNPLERSAACVLRIYHCNVEIWTLSCLDPSPLVYDEHEHRFEKIIEYAKQSLNTMHSSRPSAPPPFSFEMGIIPPLFFTVWKCHHPRMRRQALELIQRAPAQEALFRADINYRAGRKIIELEEGPNMLPIELAPFDACIEAGSKIVLPPEQDRINGVVVHYENEKGEKVRPSLIYTKGRSPGTFAWEQETTTVPI